MNHFAIYSKYSYWPKKFTFEEYKWRAEFLYLSYEIMLGMCIEDSSLQAKYYAILLFQSYIRNIETQIAKFRADSGQAYDEDVEDSKQAPKYERLSHYYACVNSPYPESEVPPAHQEYSADEQ